MPRLGRGSREQSWVLLAVAASLFLVMSVKPADSTDPGQTAPPAAAPAPADPANLAAPAALAGSVPVGCVVDDPTTDGCVTATTAHALAEIDRTFGGYRQGPKIRSAGCWDRHAWNPASDHPKGRGCDFFFGKAGVFPEGAQRDAGWELAHWLRANAEPLQVKYLIWQGRIWQASKNVDVEGWGRPYRGGGVYDPNDVTGGHWDHVHVSFAK